MGNSVTTFHALSIPRVFFRACRDQTALSYPALLFWSCICRRGRLRGRTHETQHFGVFLLYPRRCLFSLVSEMITSLRWPMASKSFIFLCVFFSQSCCLARHFGIAIFAWRMPIHSIALTRIDFWVLRVFF